LAKISGADAVKEIFSSLHISDIAAVGFDEIEAKRLGLKKGDKITVVPVDSGLWFLFIRTNLGLTFNNDHFRQRC